MRLLVPAMLLASVLLLAPTAHAAPPCWYVEPAGDRIDCMYAYGGEVLDDVTDDIDRIYSELPLCVREPTHPACWT